MICSIRSEADSFIDGHGVNRLATGFVTSPSNCGYISAGAVSSADSVVSEVTVSDPFDDELDFSDDVVIDDFLADLISPAWKPAVASNRRRAAIIRRRCPC